MSDLQIALISGTLAIVGSVIGAVVGSLLTIYFSGVWQRRFNQELLRREDARTARNWANAGRSQNLKGFDLTRAQLSGIDLDGADLESALLEEARMWGTHLKGAKLIRASFRKAILDGVEFNGANLHSADFKDATLRRVNFSGAVLRRTDLSRIKLAKDCTWQGALIDDTTKLTRELEQVIEGLRQS